METKKTYVRKNLVLFVSFLLLSAVLLFGLVSSGGANFEPLSPQEDNLSFSAIVVVQSTSGKSYLDDMNAILTMPELKTQEEMRAFLDQYTASDEDIEAVSDYLRNQGFTIQAKDHIFIVISGNKTLFSQVLSPGNEYRLESDENQRLLVMKSENLGYENAASGNSAIDGVIIFSRYDHLLDSLNKARSRPGCGAESVSLAEVAQRLGVDYLHEAGIRGQGVNIAFWDMGVNGSHPYFNTYPANITYFRELTDNPATDQVFPSNFQRGIDNGHGTMIAAILATFAPDANLISTSKTSGVDLFTAMIYLNEHDLVDIFTLSTGIPEYAPNISEEIALVRIEFIQMIADGKIVLVSAGNAHEMVEGYDAGYNALAAIPEVIAVGGADLDLTASGGYPVDSEDSITGAASFMSSLFPGRHVPDIVGFYGSDICYPYFVKKFMGWTIEPALDFGYPDGYYRGPVGTSGAAPEIAAIVALLKQNNPTLNQAQVRSILQNNALDITDGVSGYDEPAGPGYDLATGYGLPMANWVYQGSVNIYPGWNLIGLTKEHSAGITALQLLNEINTSIYRCNNISHWRVDSQLYESIQVESDGSVYGFDFPLEIGEGFFLRCISSDFSWQPSGDQYVSSPQTIHFQQGINLISIPYSQVPCSAWDISEETNMVCNRVYSYNGQWLESLRSPNLFYGLNVPLNPGEGYLVKCSQDIDWTPSCTAFNSNADRPDLSTNIFSNQLDQIINSLSLPVLTGVEAFSPLDQTLCAPQSVHFSNITDQQFSVSWISSEPCMGSIVLHNGENPVFQAYDDRGQHFSGTTHHITLSGLEAETTYSFGIVSGSVWDDNGGVFYQVHTGNRLSNPSHNYNIHGIINAHSTTGQDVVVYVQLENLNTSPVRISTLLSFPMDEFAQGYALTLDNARISDASAYFGYTSATHLLLSTEGGAAGSTATELPIQLNITPVITAAVQTLPETSPGIPSALAPTVTILATDPTFRFVTTDPAAGSIYYRLEISRDNFNTILATYDQQQNTEGWSAASYSSGQEAQFTIYQPLDRMGSYQWRVFAYNGYTWSRPSEVTSFSIAAKAIIYLPIVTLHPVESNPIVPTPVVPTATPRPTPTTTPQIPPPDPLRVEELTIHVRFNWRASVNPPGHNIPVRVVIRELDGTVLYAADDIPVTSGTTPDQDYGYFTLQELAHKGIFTGQNYEILITGKMHLTRKWTFSVAESVALLHFTEVLWPGDFNGDNVTDLGDYDLLHEGYNRYKAGEPVPDDPNAFLYKCDLNGDHKISITDINIFVDSYNNGPLIGDQ